MWKESAIKAAKEIVPSLFGWLTRWLKKKLRKKTPEEIKKEEEENVNAEIDHAIATGDINWINRHVAKLFPKKGSRGESSDNPK